MDKDIVEIRCPMCNDKTHDWKDVFQSNGSVLTKVDALYITWCQSNNEYLLLREEDFKVVPGISQELSKVYKVQNN